MGIAVFETLIVLMLMISAYSVGHMRGVYAGKKSAQETVKEYQGKYAWALRQIEEMVDRRYDEAFCKGKEETA